jgi:amino acid permease
MQWYNYLSAFFAGFFLANTIPHFVSGIMGNKFPTPFAKPPGKGLSSAPVNMVWSLFNLLVGYFLLLKGTLSNDQPISLVVFFAGIALCGIMLSMRFQHKDKE